MATAKRRGEGGVLLYTAGSDLARGEVVNIDSAGFTGVLLDAIANGASGEVAITGLYEVTKTASSSTWSAGARLAIASGACSTASNGMHRAYKATVNTDTTALVLINIYGNA